MVQNIIQIVFKFLLFFVIFISMIHCELIYLVQGLNFAHLHVNIQLFQHHFLRRLFFPSVDLSFFFEIKKAIFKIIIKILEVGVRIELTHGGFAGHGITTLLSDQCLLLNYYTKLFFSQELILFFRNLQNKYTNNNGINQKKAPTLP